MKKGLKKVVKYLTLLLWLGIVFYPLLIILFGSFMTHNEFSTTAGLGLPVSFLNVSNYQQAFIEGEMLRGFGVTFLLLLFGVSGSVVIGSMVAYVLNRFNFKFKKLILGAYFLVSMVPMTVSQIATFKLMIGLNLYNTIWAPIVLYLGADVVMIYIYLQALEKIPVEFDKAAILEGASYLTIYRQVIFPLMKPATATVVMLKVMSIYNDFYLPYLYMPGEKLNTISTTIYRFVGPNQTQWEVICACIIISMIPMIVLYIFLQKYIFSGLTAGGVKG
ncbi:carbohydrate ABC transporter permease [Vagococcus salmoninarum]|uniref:carbohydrate ABC transporter permease n=1 Tax=Vagococcus salmoninarum TaxID=2739 RepID=UPI003F9A75F5